MSRRRRERPSLSSRTDCAPHGIKNPENDPEREVCGPNWIRNPENDPERVVGRLNWIKNPGNDPERVVGRLNWIKNPENDPAREEVTGRLQSGWSGISRRICYLCNKRE